MRLLPVTLLSVALAIPAVAQQQPSFGERVDVNAVLIDTVVTDSKGNQILGLDRNDFVVIEEGAEQSVDSVDYYTNRRLLSATEENAPFKVERVHEERYFVIFLDKPEGGQLFDQLARARRGSEDFINDLGPNDLVAIAGHDVRLKVYVDFTNDKKQLKHALNDAAIFSRGLNSSDRKGDGASILAHISSREMMNQTGTVYQAIELLAGSLRPIRGRKNLIVFSPGIVEPGEEVRGGMLLNTSRYYDPMIKALNGANVTVYGANLFLNEAAPVFHQTLERMTRETNGDYWRNAVSFQPVFRGVTKATSGYYLLTYRATPKSGTGFQKVNVEIRNHPEFRVKARAGYAYGE